MDSDLLLVFAILSVGAVIIALTALGCVLLTKLFFGFHSQPRRVFFAPLTGSTVISSLLWIFWYEDTRFYDETDVVAASLTTALIFLTICFAVSWFPAQIATKRLDRMTEIDVEPFA